MECWIITEGMAGTENQCIGVTEALGLEPRIIRLQLRQPWKTLTPHLPFLQSWSFIPALRGPWPDLLITSGRKAIAAAQYIKKQNPRTFIVHLQDPRTATDVFDLIAVPHHDKLRGHHVIVTDGAPNRINADRLNAAPRPFQADKPLVGVLIGGDSKTHRLTPAVMARLSGQLQQLAQDYKFLITVSRRTSPAQVHQLTAALSGTDAYLWDGTGDNPYFSILAQADTLLVTNDSASMISDAGTTGKPVYLIPLEGSSPKFERLYRHFKALGVARDFEGILENWSYPPLADAQKIADFVRKASGLF